MATLQEMAALQNILSREQALADMESQLDALLPGRSGPSGEMIPSNPSTRDLNISQGVAPLPGGGVGLNAQSAAALAALQGVPDPTTPGVNPAASPGAVASPADVANVLSAPGGTNALVGNVLDVLGRTQANIAQQPGRVQARRAQNIADAQPAVEDVLGIQDTAIARQGATDRATAAMLGASGAPVMQAAANEINPEAAARVQDPQASPEEQQSAFEELMTDTRFSNIMLGTGLALLRGESLGNALTAGVRRGDQAVAAEQAQALREREATRQEVETGSRVTLNSAQAQNLLAAAGLTTAEISKIPADIRLRLAQTTSTLSQVELNEANAQEALARAGLTQAQINQIPEELRLKAAQTQLTDAQTALTEAQTGAIPAETALTEARTDLTREQILEIRNEATAEVLNAGGNRKDAAAFTRQFNAEVQNSDPGDPFALTRAKATAAQTMLNSDPDSETFQNIRDQNLRLLVEEALAMDDEEESNAELEKIQRQFPEIDIRTL